MIFRTFPAHHGVSITVTWDATRRSFSTGASLPSGQLLWMHISGLPTIAALRRTLLGHRIALPGGVVDRLIDDRLH